MWLRPIKLTQRVHLKFSYQATAHKFPSNILFHNYLAQLVQLMSSEQ